jgi:hypothetical protein
MGQSMMLVPAGIEDAPYLAVFSDNILKWCGSMRQFHVP